MPFPRPPLGVWVPKVHSVSPRGVVMREPEVTQVIN